MKFEKKYAALFAASFGVLAIGAAAHGQVISGTTYEYTTPDAEATCCVLAPSPAVADHNETARQSSFGSGILNDGLTGNQTYLDSLPLNSGSAPAYAYQVQGGVGANDGDGPNLAAGSSPTQDVFTNGVYFGSGAMEVVFNLGASYSNLSTAVISYAMEPAFNAPGVLTITDGTHTTTPYTFTGADTDPVGHGTYHTESVDISALSGQMLTLDFAASGNTYFALNEIDFTTSAVPEPASLSLLSLGGLALLRRRARKA